MTIHSPESINSTLIERSSPDESVARGEGRSFLKPLGNVAEWLDARPKVLLITLIAVYTCISLPTAFLKPLWHDELITYDLVSMPSVSAMLKGIRLIDLNPPVLYLLDYVAIRIPGAHLNDQFVSLAARLPSIVGGLVASVALFFLMRRRMGQLYAFALVCIYWNTPFFKYVIEDRPYALVSGLVVMLICVWERAIQAGRSLVWVALTLVLGLAVMGSHFMSGIVLVAFIAATIVSGSSRGRFDIPLLTSYLLPFAIPAAYYAKMRGYGSILFPEDSQPSWIAIPVEYALLVGSSVLIFGALLVVYMVMGFLGGSSVSAKLSAQPTSSGSLTANRAELVLLVGLLLQPAMVVITIMRVHGAFFLRYGLLGCIPIAILITVFIYALFNGAKYAALIVVLASVMAPLPSLGTTLAQLPVDLPKAHADSSGILDYHSVELDLPFVAASGLTFVEMNHREPVDFLSRVYYLTDTDAAIHAHATLFEHEAEVREMFHYPARVETLRAFEAEHPRFLVLGTVNYPEDWLLRKLNADGEDVRLVGTFRTSYKDRQIYDVTLRQR
jgi:Dolichyl-phosphate-mannose-protein mannosyltransferase